MAIHFNARSLSLCAEVSLGLNCKRPINAFAMKMAVNPQCVLQLYLNLFPQANPDLHEFTRRVKCKEWHEVLHKIFKNKAFPSDEEVTALKTLNFSHSIFKHNEWPLFVFTALFLNKLNIDQAISLFLYDACIWEEGAEKVNVFSLQQLNEVTLGILKQAVQGYFDEGQLGLFLDELKDLPREDTVFYTYPIQVAMDDKRVKRIINIKNRNVTEIEALYHVAHFRLFLPYDTPLYPRKITAIVFSPKLCHKLYKIKCHDQTIKPNCVLGYSTNGKDFEDPSKRDVLIPCRYIGQPKEADGYIMSTEGMYRHDITYHVYQDSCNPHRVAWTEIALLFRKTGTMVFYEFFLDREFPMYAGVYPYDFLERLNLYDHNKVFWATLAQFNARFYDGDGLFEKATIGFKEACSLIVNHIKENDVRWDAKYHISFYRDARKIRVMNEAIANIKNDKDKPEDWEYWHEGFKFLVAQIDV